MAENTRAEEDGRRGVIVVGHDGSSGAERALKEALEIAEGAGAYVEIVRAWTIDTAPPGTLFAEGTVAPVAEVDDAVRARLEKDVAALVAQHPSVSVVCRATLGHASEVLLDAAETARMLVVGSRGRGGFAALLLGSVSDQCVRHARCPVLVVPPSSRGPGRRGRP
ncbi:universal stress protein [Labedella populi]|nr:universal stress protein [Labedella populi]